MALKLYFIFKLGDFSRTDVILPMRLSILAGISNLFLYWFFEKMATESFEKIYLEIKDRQDLSIRLQKHFFPMIISAQRPIHYLGFNVAILD